MEENKIVVALHAEGVDRNEMESEKVMNILQSPSMRRAWIEIYRLALGL